MDSARSSKRLYTIGEAASLLDVHPETLRRWEKAGKITTRRTPSGYRVFSEEDVLKLKDGGSSYSATQESAYTSQNVQGGVKQASSKPYITLRIPRPRLRFPSANYKILAMLLITLVSLSIAGYTLLKFSPYPHQAVLGVETYVAPVLEESAPLGSLLSRIGGFFKNNSISSFALTIVQKVEQPLQQEENLNIKGKAQIAKDIEGLGNLKIKGTASVGKLVTGIVDPYLIENDGSVQSTLEIKSVGDIQLEPGSLNINLTNSSLSNVNNITSQGTISGGSLTLSNNSTIGGNLQVLGNTTLTGTINGNTFNSTQLIFSGSSPSIYPTTAGSQISLNASGTGAINIGNSSTGDIYIGGGSTTGDYCLITNSNGSLNCSSDITTGGNLHVNGGTIATSQTSFNLLNDTATTINLGGGATTLKIGATTGTTTVNNALTATGALTGSSTLSITGTSTLTGATTLSSTLAVTGATTLTGALTANGNITLGSSSSQTAAINARITTSIIPQTTGSIDLGSSSLKFNNLYSNTVNTASTNTSGQAIFTQNPASTAIADASVLINPTTVTNNGSALLGIAVGGTEKARIDETGKLTLQGGLTIAANQNFTLSSGTGTQTQTYSNSSGTASTLNVTNSASSGTTTVNGLGIALTGTANATGSNTLNAVNLSNVTAQTNNTFNALNFGTGFNNFITSGTFNLSAAGALSGATTISASGNINSTSGALQTNSITRIDNSGNLTAGTGSFAGAVTASVDNTYALGSSSVRWSTIYVSGDVNAGDVVFNNDFRLRERGKTGIDLLTPDGVVVASFDRLGNIWIRGEIKKIKD